MIISKISDFQGVEPATYANPARRQVVYIPGMSTDVLGEMDASGPCPQAMDYLDAAVFITDAMIGAKFVNVSTLSLGGEVEGNGHLSTNASNYLRARVSQGVLVTTLSDYGFTPSKARSTVEECDELDALVKKDEFSEAQLTIILAKSQSHRYIPSIRAVAPSVMDATVLLLPDALNYYHVRHRTVEMVLAGYSMIDPRWVAWPTGTFLRSRTASIRQGNPDLKI